MHQPESLTRRERDSVAAAARDLSSGRVVGRRLATASAIEVELRDSVPLGHNVALDQAAESLTEICDRAVNGRLTGAESGHLGYTVTKPYPSA